MKLANLNLYEPMEPLSSFQNFYFFLSVLYLNSDFFLSSMLFSIMFNFFVTPFGGWLAASLICLNVTV